MGRLLYRHLAANRKDLTEYGLPDPEGDPKLCSVVEPPQPWQLRGHSRTLAQLALLTLAALRD
jgi:hypothetical protein